MNLLKSNILNQYVNSYILQIQIIELYKTSSYNEKRFLNFILENNIKLKSYIEYSVLINKKNTEPFINLKHELNNCLNKSYLYKEKINIQNIYKNFQNILNNIEKTLKI